MKQKQNEKTFEESLKELEAVVAKLESADLTLDDALRYFEDGVGYIQTCERHLKRAGGKLKEILKGKDGNFIEKTLGITLDSVLGGDEFDG